MLLVKFWKRSTHSGLSTVYLRPTHCYLMVDEHNRDEIFSQVDLSYILRPPANLYFFVDDSY